MQRNSFYVNPNFHLNTDFLHKPHGDTMLYTRKLFSLSSNADAYFSFLWSVSLI